MAQIIVNVSAFSKATGSYTGNDTADRGIPHSLGKIPSLVIITAPGSGNQWLIMKDSDYIYKLGSAPYAVATLDTTNFYVGDAASYAGTANAAGVTYEWLAIG